MRSKIFGLGVVFLWALVTFPAGVQGATFWVTNTNDSGAGSLRQAILSANVFLGKDTIRFNIPGASPHHIQPLSPLPVVTDPVIIDGTTQPGFAGSPIIELDGTNAGPVASGLSITAGGSTVRGLVINRFRGSGIVLSGAGGNVIKGNYIGTDVSGNTALANGREGVFINASGNLIGGTTVGDRNVISGNGRSGVNLEGSGATKNRVYGNFIGTNAAGTAALGNTHFGVRIVLGASDNVIGGAQAGARNVISGNGLAGVQIVTSGTTGNLVQGNRIGVAADGNTAVPNGLGGVDIGAGAQGNTIGPGNLISSNKYGGVAISGSGTDGNRVIGNIIGLKADGTALGNAAGPGIAIGGGAEKNRIGGTTPGTRNVLSGNAYAGIAIQGGHNNLIQGNYIGTSSDGMAARPNERGVHIFLGKQNIIVGTTPGAGNVISGNINNGIVINGLGAPENHANQVQGNLIGLKADGSGPLPNGAHGVFITGGSQNNIIGAPIGQAPPNVISGNGINGILIEGSTTSGNRLQGNRIGTNPAGTAAMGNGQDGVRILGAPGNTIGGTNPGEGNLISGNGSHGVEITESASQNNLVQGNLIGTDLGGAPVLGNSGHGVLISGASNNTIGGTGPGAGNTIARNAGDGVSIASGTGNAILSNHILANAGLGIDLGPNGVTANDPGDADTGANNVQNHPVLTSVISDGVGTTIKGTLNSAGNTTFRLEFFANATVDPSAHGEGEKFIGSGVVTTDGGNASFTFTFPVGVPTGHAITATATRQAAPTDTSEFSKSVTVSAAMAVWKPQNSTTAADFWDVAFTDLNNGWVVGLFVNVRTANSGVTWNWFVPPIGGLALRGVVFRNASKGWAVGHSDPAPWGGVVHGIILHTTDGGANWTIQANPFGHYFTGVSFVDDQSGWVSGWYGVVFRTLDGGAKWTQVGSQMPTKLQAVAFTDLLNGWVVGWEFWYPTGNPPAHHRAVILHTADGGQKWNTQYQSPVKVGEPDRNLLGVAFVDALTGWAVGSEGMILHTKDGGAHWDPQASGTSEGLTDVFFVNKMIGYVVGAKGTILRTVDGGVTWKAEVSGTTEDLRAVTFVDATNGWAVGFHGTILRRELVVP